MVKAWSASQAQAAIASAETAAGGPERGQALLLKRMRPSVSAGDRKRIDAVLARPADEAVAP